MDEISNSYIKDTRWVELGVAMKKLYNNYIYLNMLIHNKFGKSNKISSNFWKLERCFTTLKSNLDDIVCNDYPLNVHTLPHYDHISITKVFYNINIDIEENNPPLPSGFKKLPKSLTIDEKIRINNFLNDLILYISSIKSLYKDKRREKEYIKNADKFISVINKNMDIIKTI